LWVASISPTQPSRLLCQFCGGCFPQARTFDSIMCLHEHPLSGSPYILGFPCPNFLFRGALAICCLSLPRFNSCSAINILSLPKDKHTRYTKTHKRTALAEAQRKKLLHTLAGMLKAARVGLVGGGGGPVVWTKCNRTEGKHVCVYAASNWNRLWVALDSHRCWHPHREPDFAEFGLTKVEPQWNRRYVPCGQRLLALLWKDKTNKDFVILSDYLKIYKQKVNFQCTKSVLKANLFNFVSQLI